MAYSNHNTKKRHFKHLTPYERGQIQVLQKEGKTLQEIADLLDRHKSTISRELKRGTVIQRRSDLSEYMTYFPETGQARYEANRSHCGAKYKLVQASDFIRFAVEKIQKEHWSPDAVCGFAKANQLFGVVVCTKTLYNYIDLGALPVKNIDLPLKVTRNTKKKRNRVNKKILGESIEQRPSHINERTEFGHWEIDTVLGSRQKGAVLLTLTERMTRKEVIMKIDQKTTTAIHHAIQQLRNQYKTAFSSIFKTITSDNGSEFSERGSNECHNGLIRRFIPKGKFLATRHQMIYFLKNCKMWLNLTGFGILYFVAFIIAI